MKKIAIILASGIIGYHILNMLLFTGFSDPFLRIEVLLSQDEIIAQKECGNGYNWKVVETDRVRTGNLFAGNTPSEIISYRHFILSSNEEVLVDQSIYSSSGQYLSGVNSFPAGESFTRMFIYGKDYFSATSENNLAIALNSRKISPEKFDELSICLLKDRTNIEQSLGTAFDRPSRLGWLMRLDDSIRSQTERGPEFTCNDGQKLVISKGVYLQYEGEGSSLSRRIGIVKSDGKVYDWKASQSSDNQKTVDLPKESCKSNNGQTLENFLISIPERITILD